MTTRFSKQSERWQHLSWELEITRNENGKWDWELWSTHFPERASGTEISTTRCIRKARQKLRDWNRLQ